MVGFVLYAENYASVKNAIHLYLTNQTTKLMRRIPMTSFLGKQKGREGLK
jgi:hypothetical protein